MKKHIDQIEISDFRGFENYTSISLKDAELVVFLGLNGFGKTSIFDAVEWGLTGKLSRYEFYNDGGRKQDFGKEKQVLRNKIAEEPNTYVKIELSDGKKIGRKTIKGVQADYNAGLPIEDCNFDINFLCRENVQTEFLNSYFSATHLLSQETISDFITSKKPEERYKALSINFGTAVFSPFDDNISAITNLIDEKKKALDVEIKTSSAALNEIETHIVHLKSSYSEDITSFNEIIEQINSLITPAKKFQSASMSTDEIVFSPNLLEELRAQYISFKKITDTNYKKRQDLLFVKHNYEKFKNDIVDLKEIEQQIFTTRNLVKKIQSLSSELSRLSIEISNIDTHLEKLTSKKLKLNVLAENLDFYNLSKGQINNLQKGISELENQRGEDMKNEPLIRQSAHKNEQKIVDLNAMIKTLTEIKNKGTLNVDTIRAYPAFITQSENLILKKTDALTLLESKHHMISGLIIDGKNPEISLIQKAISFTSHQAINHTLLRETTDLLEFEITEITNKSRLLEIYNKETDDTKRILEDATSSMALKKKMLLESIRYLNSDIKNCNCPVCDTMFETDQLLERITSQLNSEENELIHSVKKRLASFENLQKDLKKQISNHEDSLEKYFLDSLSLLEQIAKTLSDDLLQAKKSLAEEKENRNSKQKTVLEFIESFERFFKNKYISFDEAIKVVDAEVRLLQGHILEQIAQHQKDLEQIMLIQSRNENRNTQLQNLIINLNGLKEGKFKEISNLLFELGIPEASENIKDSVSIAMQDAEEKFKYFSTAKETEEKNREDKKTALADITKDQSQESLNSKNTELEMKRSNIKSFFDVMSEKLLSLGLEQDKLEEKILVKVEDKLDQSDAVANQIMALVEEAGITCGSFSDFNKSLGNRRKISSLKKKQSELKEKSQVLANLGESFDSLKRQFPFALKNVLLKNFDVDLFNRIYSALSPHRRFETMNFDIEVLRNRVGINFNAKNSKEDELGARPEFLFSSAQLNTFGICMFLSMALRQNWLDLDTILIDDPIQNLDDINILSFVDFIRGVLDSEKNKKQIIISTHDERFYGLILKKFEAYKVKAYRLESYGKLNLDFTSC